MEPKKLISPLLLIGLFAAFGVVCFMVGITKGKSAKWIARKMKIGGVILTLTSISSSCSLVDPPIVSCYDPIAPNVFQFDQMDDESYQLVADLPNDSILSGTIYSRQDENFGFEVLKNDTVVIQVGEVVPGDGAFDASPESFQLTLNSKIDTGMYRLNITQPVIGYPDERYPIANFQLKVK